MTVFLKDLQDIQNIQNDAKAKQVKADNLKNQADNLSMEVCCDLAEAVSYTHLTLPRRG